MAYEHTLLDVDAGIGTITMNRPEKLNSWIGPMRDELGEAIGEMDGREDVRVIVITGAGRGFCTGADVGYLKKLIDANDVDGLRGLIEAGRTVVTRIRTTPKPVIAAVNGPAAGGGANLALACDIRIASDRASIGQTFNRIGLHPDWGGSYFLPRLVGLGKATELIFTAEMVPAEEAERIGLFNRVVPHDDFDSEVRALAEGLAAKPPLALKLAKGALNRSLSSTLEEMIDYEAAAQIECFRSGDAAEGVAAFMEKRTPEYGSAS